MEISGPGRTDRSRHIYLQKVVKKLRQAGISPGGEADEVEISDVGRFLSYLSQLPEVRQERVDALRKQIEDSEYDVDSKVEEIVDDILEDLGIPPARVG